MEKVKQLTLVLMVALGVVLTGCQNVSRGQWGAAAGTLTGAAAGAALGGEDDRLEGALIGAAVGGGTGYLIGSHLDKKHQRRIMQEYNAMMKLNTMEKVDKRIARVGDSVLGNKDNFASAQEKSKAISQLRKALDTAADESGNRDGKASSWERKQYMKKYGERPLIQRLQSGY